MTVIEAIRSAGALLGRDGEFEGRAMAAHLLKLEISRLGGLMFSHLTEEQRRSMEDMVNRRLGGEPLQYILGEWEFMGLPFYTEPCALIPRQDTETLCELALTLPIRGRMLDMCCGTGCIGVSLAKLGGFEPTFADISRDCLELARRNAGLNGVAGGFILSDLFENISGEFQLICCNPPYIPTGELDSLQAEVKREPMLALDGGADGLDFYRRIAGEYRKHLSPGGYLLMEVGIGQARGVAKMFHGGSIHKDLCGVERVVMATRPGM